METGQHGVYQWLQTEHSMREVMGTCSWILLNRFLVVTCTGGGDSSSANLDPKLGWIEEEGIGYGPLMTDAHLRALPWSRYSAASCDWLYEWYLFDERVRLGRLAKDRNVFVDGDTPRLIFPFANFLGFRLAPPFGIEQEFWRQIERIQPTAYLGEAAEVFLFASRNAELFNFVHTHLRDQPSEYA